jgi:2-iminobutanoate/2-iminopropanoate deaminase
MLRLFNPDTVCKPFSRYSQGALVEGHVRWLHISGQVGARADGQLEEGFEAQAKQAWANLIAVLEAGGMQREHLVKVSVFLTRAGDVAASRAIRDAALLGAAPASTLLVVAALARPDILFEVEALAAKSE